jgi:hypothetical protein
VESQIQERSLATRIPCAGASCPLGNLEICGMSFFLQNFTNFYKTLSKVKQLMQRNNYILNVNRKDLTPRAQEIDCRKSSKVGGFSPRLITWIFLTFS